MIHNQITLTIPIHRNELAAKVLLVSIWILMLSGFIALAYQLEYTLSMDVMIETFRWIYMSPLYRFTPYFWGTVGAWYLNTNRPLLLIIQPSTEKIMWYVSGILFLGVIFMAVNRGLPPIPSLAITVAGQHAYAFFVCWMMMASALKKKSWWSKILEHNAFQHLSKLCYEIYMIGPVVISFMFSLNENGINFDLPLMVSMIS